MQKGLIVHTLVSNDDGRILILRRSKDNDILPEHWDFPGGTLEDGEDPAQGAIRETKEETGLDIAGPKLFFQFSNVDLTKNKQFVTLFFYAKSNTFEVLVDAEHDLFEWIEPKMVTEYKTAPYMSPCLLAYDKVNTKPIN